MARNVSDFGFPAFRGAVREIILATAREYLRPNNRTILSIVPGAATAATAEAAQ